LVANLGLAGYRLRLNDIDDTVTAIPHAAVSRSKNTRRVRAD
jgi:hypothetical protein